MHDRAYWLDADGHCMTVSLADGGMGLGTMWGEQTARKMLGEAGSDQCERPAAAGDRGVPKSRS
jgi:hypothetical protein